MFPVAAGFAIPLAFVGNSDAALVSAIVFGAAVTAMFAVSGFYHVITWQPECAAGSRVSTTRPCTG